MKNSQFSMLLAVTDLVFAFLIWIVRPEAFTYVFLLIVLFSGVSVLTGLWLERRRQEKITQAMQAFLEAPDERRKNILIQSLGQRWREPVETLYDVLDLARVRLGETAGELSAYQEFIEAWVHEIKTPLFLLSLVAEGHEDEMSPYVKSRMDYISLLLSQDVDRILYYARLQADHADYQFTEVRLDDAAEEVAGEYRSAMEERNISLWTELLPLTVRTDGKVLHFMLSQLMSNAVKYADREKGEISVSMSRTGDKTLLVIWNNGEGVPIEDMPFLFDKGFTGSHPDRQKATGMGLYLVKKFADKLCVDVQLARESSPGEGFGIRLIFTE